MENFWAIAVAIVNEIMWNYSQFSRFANIKVVTVNVKYKDGTEKKFSVAAAKSYFETSELPGVREDIGDGSLFVTGQISGDYETDNSVKLSNDAVSDYFDGIESFWVLNISE